MNKFQEAMLKSLEEKNALSECPRCGNDEFSMNDKPFNLESGGSGENTGDYMPCILLACSKCGYIFLHSIEILEEALSNGHKNNTPKYKNTEK